MSDYGVEILGFAIMVLAIGFAAVALLTQVGGLLRDIIGALS